MKLTKNDLIGLIQYVSGEFKEDLIDVTEQDAESILNKYLKAINYTRCSEQLKDKQTISFKELMELKEMIETYSEPIINELKKDKYRYSFTKKGWVLTSL